jgi:hypothetical protein
MSESMRIANNAIILNNGEIYQVSNIASVKIEKLPRRIPEVMSISLILGLLTFSLILFTSSKNSDYAMIYIICLFLAGCLIIDLTSSGKKQLSLRLNDGTSKSFVTCDGEGLRSIEYLILDLMDNRGDKNTESIVHIYENKPVKIVQNKITQDHRKFYDSSVKASGNISGNVMSGIGKLVDQSVTAGRDLIGKTFTGSVKNASSSGDTISTTSSSPSTNELYEILDKFRKNVEAETQLDSSAKAVAIEQTNILTKAVQSPTDEGMKKAAKNSMWILKGILSGLHSANTLISDFEKLQTWVGQLLGF